MLFLLKELDYLPISLSTQPWGFFFSFLFLHFNLQLSLKKKGANNHYSLLCIRLWVWLFHEWLHLICRWSRIWETFIVTLISWTMKLGLREIISAGLHGRTYTGTSSQQLVRAHSVFKGVTVELLTTCESAIARNQPWPPSRDNC